MSKKPTPASAQKAAPKVASTISPARAKAEKVILDKVNKNGGFFTDGLVNFLARVGQRADNVNAASMYIFDMLTRNRIQLEAMYRGSWVVGAVVDSKAEDMTRAGIVISTSEGADNVKEMHTAMSRLKIWTSLCSTLRWGFLYGGSIAVLQIQGQSLDTPLRYDTIQKAQFKGLAVYDRWQIQPDLTNLIQEGPDMGLPEYYRIVTTAVAAKMNDKGTTPNQAWQMGQAGIRIHHSRIIRQIGIELPSWQAQNEEMWGMSVIERLWDRLNSFDMATLSAGNLVNRAYLRTVQVDGLREILAAGGQAQENLVTQFAMMRELQTNEGLTLMDKLDTFSTASYTFSGLSDVILQFFQQVSGASGIPMVRLAGQSPAGLNATGDSDIRNYYDNINSLQESRLRDGVEKILNCVYRSTFGLDLPSDLDFTFAPLWQMSALDKATVGKTTAETIVGAHDSGLIDAPTAMKELRQAGDEVGLFQNITDEAIDEAAMEPPTPQLTTPTPDPAALADPTAALKPALQGVMDSMKAVYSRLKGK